MGIKEFIGTTEQFTTWVMDNIHDIAKQCGWAEIESMTPKALVLNNEEREVHNLTIMHADGIKTHIMCEISNDGLPFSACLESFIAIKAIQTVEKFDGRVVVVSPIVSERIVDAIQSNNVPINFLMVNKSEVKYWSCAK